MGTPFRTTFRTAGEFALKKLNLSDLTADLIESDHIGSITGDVSIRSHVTPVEVFCEDDLFGATEFVTQIPSVSIQTVNSNDDLESTLIQPNANLAQEQQEIRVELFVTYQLSGNEQVFTELVRGDFNYIDLAAEGAPPIMTRDRDALILGTLGRDVLKGTDANEEFNALAGADTIRAGGGDDTISGRG